MYTHTHTTHTCACAMASLSGSSATKEVLVCLGERKRPITLAKDASVDDLKVCVVREYGDVIPRSSSATDEAIASSLILQVKSETWDGVFVDVKSEDEVVDKSVFRVATATPEV